MPKRYRFCHRGMGQTDRQTGGQADGLQHRELIILILRTMLMMLSS